MQWKKLMAFETPKLRLDEVKARPNVWQFGSTKHKTVKPPRTYNRVEKPINYYEQNRKVEPHYNKTKKSTFYDWITPPIKSANHTKQGEEKILTLCIITAINKMSWGLSLSKYNLIKVQMEKHGGKKNEPLWPEYRIRSVSEKNSRVSVTGMGKGRAPSVNLLGDIHFDLFLINTTNPFELPPTPTEGQAKLTHGFQLRNQFILGPFLLVAP